MYNVSVFKFKGVIMEVVENITLAKRVCLLEVNRIVKGNFCAKDLKTLTGITKFLDKPEIDVSNSLTARDYRDGWVYVLNHLGEDLSCLTLLDIHDEVIKSERLNGRFSLCLGGTGTYFRTESDPVATITGSSYITEVPNPEEIHQTLMSFNEMEDAEDKALTTTLWIMRAQPFQDGNKRTATLVGNKILTENGKGVLHIKEKYKDDFIKKLIDYYETNDMDDIKSFMQDNIQKTKKL